MTSGRKEILVILLSVTVGLILVGYWLFHNPVSDFTVNNPGMDNRPDSLSGSSEKLPLVKNSY